MRPHSIKRITKANTTPQHLRRTPWPGSNKSAPTPGASATPDPPGHGYAILSGFPDAKTAGQYAQDMDTDRRRGTWIDPAASKTTVTAWVQRWLPTLDVEIRTEENYRAYLRNHILPRW